MRLQADTGEMFHAGRVFPTGMVAVLWLVLLSTFGFAQGHGLDAFEKPGPYAVGKAGRSLCCDRKGNKVDIYVPQGRKADEIFPVVTWGNGTWATPAKYQYLLRHLASWGMIVVATNDSSVGTGDTVLDSLAVLRNSEFAPLSDFRRVAAVGHSQGASGAFNAAAFVSSGIRTAILLDLPGRALCNQDHCALIPFALRRNQSLLFLSGERDPLSSSAMVKRYFDEVPDGRLAAMAMVGDADHNDIQGQPACRPFTIGCREGVGAFLPYVTAWLRWQLIGDRAAKAVFSGRNAVFEQDHRLREAKIRQ